LSESNKIRGGRRSFLKGSLIAGAGLASSATSSKADASIFNIPQGLPTLQLFTDETSAQFRILVDPEFPIVYQITSSDGHPPLIESITRTQNPYDQRDCMEHLLVTGLSLQCKYTLKIYEEGREIDSRDFHALDTQKPNGRFALVSCMMDLLTPIQGYMWDAMERAKPDVIFIIGDASYTDVGGSGSIESNWRRQMESRRALDLYYWKTLIPVVATWDDHDYAGDNATKNHPLNGHSIKVFQTMFAFTPRPSARLGPGVASVVELFGQRFFLMDDRTWRDEWNIAQGLHWGDEQENWLMNSLASSSKPAWLLNGSQYFGAYLEKDSFEGRHPFQFKRVLEKLRSIEAPVVFGSGDVHFSEIMRIEKQQIGYETFEVTSSSMHSTTAPWINIRKTNPRRITTTWHFNFILAQANASRLGRLDLRALSIGKNLNVYFDQSASIIRR
jgi:alkaline phosphatase D